MKAIGIIGYHHTGKTSVAEVLIRALSTKGFQVATIKDIHNEVYRADRSGSNSWRHARAGASQVFAHGLHDAALVLTPTPDLNQMISLLRADFLIIEGLKSAAVPKILCANNRDQLDKLIDDTVFAISGAVAEELSGYLQLPAFSLERQPEELLARVEEIAFDILPQADPECCNACGKSCYQLVGDIVQGRAERSDCVMDSSPGISLIAGGQPVSIVPFVQNILRDSILAIVNNLKDISPDADLRIELKR